MVLRWAGPEAAAFKRMGFASFESAVDTTINQGGKSIRKGGGGEGAGKDGAIQKQRQQVEEGGKERKRGRHGKEGKKSRDGSTDDQSGRRKPSDDGAGEKER